MQPEKTIGETLVEMRKGAGLTQVELARKLEIDVGTLRDYEKDTSNISVKMLNRAIEACRLDPFKVIERFAFSSTGRRKRAALDKAKIKSQI